METTGLTPEEQAVFEWQYRMTGHFRTALWGAIIKADDNNLGLLRLGFPIEVEGYYLYSRQSGWWKAVQDKAVTLGLIKYAD